MFTVTSDFEGGNAKIIGINGNKITLDADLRDTEGDWFFWCIKVTGAAGLTLDFEFPSANRVGYFGAAVSYDLENWRWQNENVPSCDGRHFSYTFEAEENEVYFAHDMIYRPARFYRFAESCGLEIKELCVSERGRAVPYIDTEKGDGVILLTARHHACESTGSYVLEGVLGDIISRFGNRYRIICVPFVDLDGVIDGDQGKNRNGHDHNRDYIAEETPKYASTAAIRQICDTLKPRYAFDFHSPWHWSGHNDTLFIPIKHYSILENIKGFSELFEKSLSTDALPHSASDDLLPDVEWNTHGTPCFGTYTGNAGAELAFTLETPYFKANGTNFSAERAIKTGQCFVKALEEYERVKKQTETV